MKIQNLLRASLRATIGSEAIQIQKTEVRNLKSEKQFSFVWFLNLDCRVAAGAYGSAQLLAMTPPRHFTTPSSIKYHIVGVIAICLFLASCVSPPSKPELSLRPAVFSDLPGWQNDNHAEALAAFVKSCDRLYRKSPSNEKFGTAAQWQAVCNNAKVVPPSDTAAKSFLEANFRPFIAGNHDNNEGLFTGYYEPLLRGSRQRHNQYKVPLLSAPQDLVSVDLGEFRENLKGQRIAGRVVNGRLRPFESREQIEKGMLRNAVPLVWVDSDVDAFFLQIQGSGRVMLDDGTEMRVGYAAQNGHQYVAIGRLLAETGELPKDNVNMYAIKKWFEDNPWRASEIMHQNPSYVFFRELGGDSPTGAAGVSLTPGRSLAVDSAFIPYGVPLWLEAEDPLNNGLRLSRLLVAQDTGGAIKGPVRGDVFWGYGQEAEVRAAHMQSKGRYWVLLPRVG